MIFSPEDMPVKPEPKKYPSGPSGRHKKPTIAFRPEAEELEAIDAAAAREGVNRNDWLRAAARDRLAAERQMTREPKARRK